MFYAFVLPFPFQVPFFLSLHARASPQKAAAMVQLAILDTCKPIKAIGRSKGAVNPFTGKPVALFNEQPPQEVKPETDEKTKVYYHANGKLEFLLMNHQLGLRSMLQFLNKQEKLKTYKNIEVHETEFEELQFRVENFGGATTIERILKVRMMYSS
ncbi:uncharacterized protein [Medicago truncatula]|uniref:uncharacterized protein n=1 Tax=Medicago truncatula TaxID=3880 RepID=UPI001967123E|nr:uncharacterized protein LOC112419189 [Medicago truncatula]